MTLEKHLKKSFRSSGDTYFMLCTYFLFCTVGCFWEVWHVWFGLSL